jgi:hypothetical protein
VALAPKKRPVPLPIASEAAPEAVAPWLVSPPRITIASVLLAPAPAAPLPPPMAIVFVALALALGTEPSLPPRATDAGPLAVEKAP